MSDITIDELLKGKSTLIKKKEFFPTKNYVEPFLNQMGKFTSDFRINVKLPDQMTKNTDMTDITYNRVLIEAVLPPEHCIDNHEEVIGFLYGLDVRKPVSKIYRGYLNQACTNLCVFNPKWISVQEINPEEPLNYNAIRNLMEDTNDFAVTLNKLKSTTISRDEQMNYLGKWVHNSLMEVEDYGFGRVKIASGLPIKAYEKLFIREDSEYYIPRGSDPTMFDIHNAFTQIVTDDKKDIMNKFEKTMIINRLLDVN